MTYEMDDQEAAEETANVAQMRENFDRIKAENTELKAFRRDTLMEKAGLDPAQGVGKAVSKDIERGDYSGEWTVEALTSYANVEYGWESTATVAAEAAETSEVQQARSLVSEGTQQLDAVQAAGSPPEVEDPALRANQAGADGDWLKQIMEGTTITVDKLMAQDQ